MGAHQIFFGALGFDSEDELDRAIEEVFSPGVSGDAPALLRETVREARLGGRTLLVSFDADMPSSHWLRFTGAFAELGGRASRGHLTMLYDGDGIELVVAGVRSCWYVISSDGLRVGAPPCCFLRPRLDVLRDA